MASRGWKGLKMHKHKNIETVYAKRQYAKLRQKYCEKNIYNLYKKI